MNRNPRIYNTSRGAAVPAAMGFLLGAVVGAGIALLLAPDSGRETRRRLADAGVRWGSAARGKLDQAREAAEGLGQDARSALKAGRETFEQSRKSHEAHADSPVGLKA